MSDETPPDQETTTVKSALQADPALADRLGVPPDSGPEQRVLKVNGAMFRSRPLLGIAVLLGLLGSGVGVIWALAIAHPDDRWSAWVFAALGLAAFVILVVWKVQSLSHSLEITNKRSVRRVGLLSKDTSEVLHDNIRNFQVRQTVWERIWGVGSIGIASSGQDDVEIQMDRVPKPERVRELIDLYRPLG